jgi:AcrR family transcriptional regulator
VAGLTTTAVARRLNVTQPAIYSHVSSVDELRVEVARHGIEQLSDTVRAAIGDLEGDDALRAMATAYREYVRRHPDLYLLQLRLGGTPSLARVSERASEPVRHVLRSYGLDEERVRQAHALLRAAIHGFVGLEAQGLMRGPNGGDDDFQLFIELLRRGLHATHPTRRRRVQATARPAPRKRRAQESRG